MPSRLDRYEIIGEIAAGGMATVFLGRLAGVGGFQRLVAIKRLHPHLASEPDFVQMFLDEARLAASIHHPHVVPILEVGTSDAGYYVVMEYVEGDTLGRLVVRATLAKEKLPRDVVLRICVDALAGLHAAHELRDEHDQPVNLVHRDVSPQNILVGVDGSARITDFGVARASSRLAQTRTGQLKGKLAYMPPEQAKGEAAVDRRADIFAVGIILFECFTGKRLFKGDTELQTLQRLLFDPIPRVSDVEADFPRDLDDAIAVALARDPDERFSSAADFADALERAASASDIAIASVRGVSKYVSRVLAANISSQRDAVRTWKATDTQSRATSNSNPPLGPPSHTPSLPSDSGTSSDQRPSFTTASAVLAPTTQEAAPSPMTKLVVPLAIVAAAAAAVVIFLATRPHEPSVSASPYPIAGASTAPVTTATASQVIAAVTTTAPIATAAPDATGPHVMSLDALPAVPGPGVATVGGGRPVGTRKGKPDKGDKGGKVDDTPPPATTAPPPATTPPPPPPPPAGGDDEYKNPYR